VLVFGNDVRLVRGAQLMKWPLSAAENTEY
jgi:hypothetical protein